MRSNPFLPPQLFLLGIVLACIPGEQLFAQAPEQVVTGTLLVKWGDPPTGGTPRMEYSVLDDGGVAHPIEIDAATLERAGGLVQLNGQRVSARTQAVRAAAIPIAKSLDAIVTTVPQALISRMLVGSRSKPYITILCRFSDETAPATREERHRLMVGEYPSVNGYWTEVAHGVFNLDGSETVGWYALPEPRSGYVLGDDADLTKLARHCSAAADPEVDFSAFAGVNYQFSGSLGCCSWGGGGMMTLDGPTRFMPTTWLASWASIGTIAHEVGHSVGLPHSGGPYGRVYDSQWDVMSSAHWIRASGSNGNWGSHTVAYHKARIGAIEPGRTVTALGPVTRVVLERSAQAVPAGAARMVVIPIAAGRDDYYTIEARGGIGYDAPLAARIVMHHVQPRRAVPAQVVDLDGNGDPNDDGAGLVPGRVFRDLGNGLAVTIDSLSGDRTHLTVLRSGAGAIALSGDIRSRRVAFGSAPVRDSVLIDLPAGAAWSAASRRGLARLHTRSGVGPATLTWEVHPSGLLPGEYRDTIHVSAPTAVGSPARVIDVTQVGDAPGGVLAIGTARNVRMDMIVAGSSGWSDSVQVRFTGPGAESATWSVSKRRSSTVLRGSTSRSGSGYVSWYHWAASLPPGIYVDTIRIDAPAVSNAPLMILDSLTILPPPNFVSRRTEAGRAILPQGGSVHDSIRVALDPAWASIAWVAYVPYGKPGLAPMWEDRVGDAVVRFTRRAGERAPGIYVDTILIYPRVPARPHAHVDTVEVRAASPGLALSWYGRADSVLAGTTTSMDSVLVSVQGLPEGSQDWEAAADTARLRLVQRNAFTRVGTGSGTEWLRWIRNTRRPPGTYVDTITVRLVNAQGVNPVMLVDNVTVLAPLTGSLARGGSVAVPLGGGAPTDSAELKLAGFESATATWTASATSQRVRLSSSSGSGSGWIRWSRSVDGLGSAIYVDTIRVRISFSAGPELLLVDSMWVAPAMVISSAGGLPAGQIGAAYHASLTATGGIGAPGWSIVEGTLPRGLTLSAAGVLSGIPEQGGDFSVTVRAATGPFESRAVVSLAIRSPQLAQDAVIDALLGLQPLPEADQRYLDLVGNRNGRFDLGDVRAWLIGLDAAGVAVSPDLERLVERPLPEASKDSSTLEQGAGQ